MTTTLKQIWENRKTDSACLCVLEAEHCINGAKCRLPGHVTVDADHALIRELLHSVVVKTDAISKHIKARREARRARAEGAEQQDNDPVKVEFLIEFCRALIRNNPSSDVMFLAFLAASRKVPLTKEQAEAFFKALNVEMAKSPWPKGFFQ